MSGTVALCKLCFLFRFLPSALASAAFSGPFSIQTHEDLVNSIVSVGRAVIKAIALYRAVLPKTDQVEVPSLLFKVPSEESGIDFSLRFREPHGDDVITGAMIGIESFRTVADSVLGGSHDFCN